MENTNSKKSEIFQGLRSWSQLRLRLTFYIQLWNLRSTFLLQRISKLFKNNKKQLNLKQKLHPENLFLNKNPKCNQIMTNNWNRKSENYKMKKKHWTKRRKILKGIWISLRPIARKLSMILERKLKDYRGKTLSLFLTMIC